MLTRLLHACGLYLGPKDELMPAQADNPDGFWEHLGFVALNDELLNALGGAWDLPPKRDENFAHARLDPLRMKARLLDRKVRFGRSLGLEGSAQQFDAAILAEPAARHENAHHGAQSIGSRPFDERAKRNFLFVWLAALGNLQPACDRDGKRTRSAGYSLRFIFRRPRIGIAANCAFHWFARCRSRKRSRRW